MKLVPVILAVVGIACCTVVLAAPTIDSSLLRRLQEKATKTIIISFKANNVAAIRDNLVFPQGATRTQRTTAIYNSLKSHADETQANVLELLFRYSSSHPITVRQLWITNQVAVKNADLELVKQLLSMDEISKIEEDVTVSIHSPVKKIHHPEGYAPQAGEQWGVAKIEAPAVWATGNRGAGVTIANIDTGVRGTHEALRDGYRSLNGWYDPTAGKQVPTDDNGHGTHTMGTIVGRVNGIGVAPEATWIACKACDQDAFCNGTELIGCGQWVLCPTANDGVTNPRCDLAPVAVSNSWGGYQELYWYNDTVATWLKAGIVPLFSIGNNGPDCGTANTPGDYEISIGVGATNSDDQVTDFSSVGPTAVTKRIKPDVAAPGYAVVSSVSDSDTAYGTYYGTSMACPHVAGLTVLLYNQRADLSVSQVRQILAAGAQPTKPTGRNCGGIDENTFPNNHVGAGRISARASVDALRNLP